MARPKSDPGKRERILQAAMKVFARRGFATARVSDVAREAGIADGTIYLYFPSKDAILISIIEEGMGAVIDGLLKKIKGLEDPQEKLKHFVRHHLHTVESDPDLAEVLLVELRFSDKFLTEGKPWLVLDKYLELLATIVAEGQKKGVFKKEVPTGVAMGTVFGALDEISLHRVLQRRKRGGESSSFDIEKVSDHLSRLLLDGLAA